MTTVESPKRFDASEQLAVRVRAARRQRDCFRLGLPESLRQAVTEEALAAHFEHMPLRYWLRVDAAALRWHLRVVHAFYSSLNSDGPLAIAPIVRCRQAVSRGVTEVTICTWDRLGLLANVAGAMAEVGLNIVRADIYTRADNVVLDLFQITDAANRPVADTERLREMKSALAALCRPSLGQALAASPLTVPRLFAGRPTASLVRMEWNNELSPECNVLYVEAPDRVGLLYRLFRLLADEGLSVAQAVVTTEQGVAGDAFFVTDRNGRKLSDNALLEHVREEMIAALAAD